MKEVQIDAATGPGGVLAFPDGAGQCFLCEDRKACAPVQAAVAYREWIDFFRNNSADLW